MNDECDSQMTVALISDVFYDREPAARLKQRLSEAKARGAELAVLPEIPMNPWSPATQSPRDDDAETPGGPREHMQADAARAVGIGLVGGVIRRDPTTGRRFNTALVFNATGELQGTFAKIHLPEEPGFWETSHYGPGLEVSPVFDRFTMPFGVQICSDINRPEGCHLLGAMGAEFVAAPRATERATIERWKVVFRANALTSAMYVLSANRPDTEDGVLIGGPSIAVAPDGTILVESTDPVSVVRMSRHAIQKARVDYPGYLPVRADLYAKAWAAVASRQQAVGR